MQSRAVHERLLHNNEMFIKMTSNIHDSDYEEDDMYKNEKKKRIIEKEKKNKAMKPIIEKQIQSRTKSQQQKINKIIEKFFISWLIHKDLIECKNACDNDIVTFFDMKDGSESETYSIVMIQLYYYYQNYEREKTRIENHIVEGNTLWYRAKTRNDDYFDGFIEFGFNDKNKIISIDVGTLDSNGELITYLPKNKSKKKEYDKNRFNDVPPKKYNYKLEEPLQVSKLPLWDYDKFLEKQKGTLYTLMFKLYRAWFILCDPDEILRLTAQDAKLYDRVLKKDFFNGKDASYYFMTFVAHHHTAGIYVRQYKIIDNELIIRIHQPDTGNWTDILVAVKINKDTNLFTEFIFRRAYFDAFKEKGDLTPNAFKGIENVYKQRVSDINRKREDFKSAVFYKMDKNMEDLNIDTFETSDTEIFLKDKLINETHTNYLTVPIESRQDIIPSPKPPLKLIYNFRSPSCDTAELFGIPTPEDENGNKIKKKKKKDVSNEKRKGLLCSDDSFLGSTDSSYNKEELSVFNKNSKVVTNKNNKTNKSKKN